MGELISIYKDVFAVMPPAAIAGVVTYVVVLIVQSILISKNKIYTRGMKKIAAARAAGRVVCATKERVYTNYYDETDTGHRRTSYSAVYSYQVNGKRYKTVIRSDSRHFSDTVTLYYDKSPKSAKTEGHLTTIDRGVLPVIMPLVLAVLVAMLVER